jgi:isopentenyl diphosphate isomerase/L-lactate dehydrogenase-like FMN-dependent dehydrogenase
MLDLKRPRAKRCRLRIGAISPPALTTTRIQGQSRRFFSLSIALAASGRYHKIDMSVDLFGTKWERDRVGASGTLFHPEGPLPVARAAQKQKTLQILGGVERNHPIEES